MIVSKLDLLNMINDTVMNMTNEHYEGIKRLSNTEQIGLALFYLEINYEIRKIKKN